MRPRVLIIDDLYGREVVGGFNEDRVNLCSHLRLVDVTHREAGLSKRVEPARPLSEAVFCRAQRPVLSGVGDVVENDLPSVIDIAKQGWCTSPGGGSCPWSLVLLDLCFYTGEVTAASDHRMTGMPEGRPSDSNASSYFGLTILDAVHAAFPDLPIFILSSKPRDEVSLEFSKHGALGFIARDDIRGAELLQAALWQHGLLPDPGGVVVGHSVPLLLALRDARRAARHRQNLLIRGERGTGKELLAHYAHRMALSMPDGKERPFITVNSAGLTSSLFASELFGIESRTATGVDAKIGYIEIASHGDLFLDEIADMPGEIQAALLRVLQEKQLARVGGRSVIDVDVRFLSATNGNLEDQSRGFRADLLDRLRVGGTLWLPPLRERIVDLPLITERFMREAEQQRAGTMRREITSEAIDVIESYDWPGNIRELRSAVFDAVNRYPDVEHLVPGHLRLGLGRPASSSLFARKAQVASPVQASLAEPKYMENRNATFSQLLLSIDQFEFSDTDRASWAGRFLQFQSAVALLTSKFIKAALVANRKPTPANPQGNILIHPAMKLLTGNPSLTASQAADLIKRCLNVSPRDRDDILKDGVLRRAHDIAVHLRPKTAHKKSHTSEKPAS